MPPSLLQQSAGVTTNNAVAYSWLQTASASTGNIVFSDSLFTYATQTSVTYYDTVYYDTVRDYADTWLWMPCEARGAPAAPRVAQAPAPEPVRYINALEREIEARDRKAAQAAEDLLLQHLAPHQQKEFKATRSFEVLGDNGRRRYRIRHGWAGNIDVFDEHGRLVEQLCIHPQVGVPFADNMLAQKLLLEADEKLFRMTANITRFGVRAS